MFAAVAHSCPSVGSLCCKVAQAALSAELAAQRLMPIMHIGIGRSIDRSFTSRADLLLLCILMIIALSTDADLVVPVELMSRQQLRPTKAVISVVMSEGRFNQEQPPRFCLVQHQHVHEADCVSASPTHQ